jgi:hypothetical protein
MKMNKHIIIGMFLLTILALFSNLALADTAEIKDTVIDYVGYREIVVDEPGVVYHIKITNTGPREKDYEIIPDPSIIRNLGTYRVDPADKITLAPGAHETVYFYLAIEKGVTGRTIIPITIRTGLSETSIDLVARPVGPLIPGKESSLLTTAFKAILIIALIIIIIIALVFSFTKIRKKKEEDEEEEDFKPEFDEDIETYY